MLPDAVEHLRGHLVSQAGKLTGTAMIDTLYSGAIKWLEEQGLDLGIESKATDDYKKGMKAKKGKKSKKAKVVEEEVMEEKKSSMKTAEDVVKRIRWDGGLNAEDFVVGYTDRFKGIMEKAFSSFTWEDIATADYHDLAIPKHRIQYFKYKKVKFWGKGERLDDMFGSTGSGKTITDVIDKYETELVKKLEQGTEDSDEDLTIHTGAEGEEENDEVRSRPNYFVCLRVSDAEILEGFAAIQDALVENDERYNDCCIESAALHITLCTVGLDNEQQIALAVKTLNDAKQELIELARKNIKVKLDGVDNFYDRVLYAKIEDNPDFMSFVHHVRHLVQNAGVEIRDIYEFTPHVTIMKTSRPASRLIGTAKIPKSIYEGYLDMYFGYQLIDGIYLCPMTADRRDDGFYCTLVDIPFFNEAK